MHTNENVIKKIGTKFGKKQFSIGWSKGVYISIIVIEAIATILGLFFLKKEKIWVENKSKKQITKQK